ncbi:hypothetical protein VOI54_17880 [Tamlana sp. 2201CG12-4]|uniref:hypothetical protein n=1 Tax=Tamlana sp. 2201CG12-4 TaxID=3112582 RepID=UPI002DBFFADD|nr:hypothetical protein [Tamlana sp. 2201CG12-4]MEC3908897.1 hypothetical protein [Tamlana sp. 2201CG12-4]
MNLDELTKNIRKVSKEETVQKLADNIQEWKTDERNAAELRDTVERFLGNSWIDKPTDFDKVYAMWTEFRKSAIDGIGGMTMNERLYWFGLFGLFDNAKNDAEQEKYYEKLMAKK